MTVEQAIYDKFSGEVLENALANTSPDMLLMDSKHFTMAFDWGSSPQGSTYWLQEYCR
jgi:hypothetical protein